MVMGMGSIMEVVTDTETHMLTMEDGVAMEAMVVAGEGLTSMALKWAQGEPPGEQQPVKGEHGGVEEGVVQGMSLTKCFVGYLDAWKTSAKVKQLFQSLK